MTIRQESDGTYLVFYSARHPKTKKPHSLRRKGIKKLTEARRIEKELVIKLNQKFNEEIVPTWFEVMKSFLTASRDSGLAFKTIENRELCLNAYTHEWMERPVSSITTSEIRDLINQKLGHRSPSQQKNVLKYIRLCMEHALDHNWVVRNPAPRMKFRVGERVKKFLSLDQVRTLLEAAKSMDVEWYPVWAMALYTGMRNGELYALTWDNVNLENRRIKVSCSWCNKSGFKDTKSGDQRFVEIAPNLLKVLRELKLSSDSNFVLPRIDKWDRGEQARELRMFLSGLGIPAIRFHDLRATWATIMLSNGVPPIKVMRMGGWKNIKTMEIYIRTAGVDIAGITNNLDLHFLGEKGQLLQLHGE